MFSNVLINVALWYRKSSNKLQEAHTILETLEGGGGLFTKLNGHDINDSFSVRLLCIFRNQHTILRVKYPNLALFYGYDIKLNMW